MGDLKERAQELLAGRMRALDALEESAHRLDRARREVRDAEAAQSTAWSAATGAGWTAAELRKLGLSQPPSRRGGRPKTSRKAAAPAAGPAAVHAAGGPAEE